MAMSFLSSWKSVIYHSAYPTILILQRNILLDKLSEKVYGAVQQGDR